MVLQVIVDQNSARAERKVGGTVDIVVVRIRASEQRTIFVHDNAHTTKTKSAVQSHYVLVLITSAHFNAVHSVFFVVDCDRLHMFAVERGKNIEPKDVS